jgi:hypothetical protein
VAKPNSSYVLILTEKNIWPKISEYYKQLNIRVRQTPNRRKLRFCSFWCFLLIQANDMGGVMGNKTEEKFDFGPTYLLILQLGEKYRRLRELKAETTESAAVSESEWELEAKVAKIKSKS